MPLMSLDVVDLNMTHLLACHTLLARRDSLGHHPTEQQLGQHRNGCAGKEGEERVDLSKESASKFKYYASGRRFVEGMLVTLDLRARQDIIMGYLLNMLLPQDDLIDFEVSTMRLSPISFGRLLNCIQMCIGRLRGDLEALIARVQYRSRCGRTKCEYGMTRILWSCGNPAETSGSLLCCALLYWHPMAQLLDSHCPLCRST